MLAAFRKEGCRRRQHESRLYYGAIIFKVIRVYQHSNGETEENFRALPLFQ
jgi:hypothetical protein